MRAQKKKWNEWVDFVNDHRATELLKVISETPKDKRVLVSIAITIAMIFSGRYETDCGYCLYCDAYGLDCSFCPLVQSGFGPECSSSRSMYTKYAGSKTPQLKYYWRKKILGGLNEIYRTEYSNIK